MKKFLLLVFFSPLLLAAQINESDSLKVRADLSVTGIWQDGNVETWIFRTKSEVVYKPWKKWVFKTRNSYVYQAFGGDKADEDVLSLNFLYFNPERKLYPLILGFASSNFRREIDLRTLFGVGGTYQLMEDKDNWLKVSLTTEFEETEYSMATFNEAEFNGRESISTFRATIWANGRYQIIDEKLILTHEGYYQPSLEYSSNYRWMADIGLEMPVWKFLNFKINYLHTYESLVVEGQKEEDRFLTFGFTLKSY